MRSQSRQVNFSRTVWITFHWRGMTSSVSVTSSPIFARRPRAAGGAGAGRGQHDPLARQVLGKGLARRLAAREGGDLGLRPRRGGFSQPFIFRGRRLHLLKLQLKLIEEPPLALGALAVEFAAQLLDLQPQMGDQRLAARQNRLGVRRLGCRQGGAQGCDL